MASTASASSPPSATSPSLTALSSSSPLQFNATSSTTHSSSFTALDEASLLIVFYSIAAFLFVASFLVAARRFCARSAKYSQIVGHHDPHDAETELSHMAQPSRDSKSVEQGDAIFSSEEAEEKQFEAEEFSDFVSSSTLPRSVAPAAAQRPATTKQQPHQAVAISINTGLVTDSSDLDEDLNDEELDLDAFAAPYDDEDETEEKQFHR